MPIGKGIHPGTSGPTFKTSVDKSTGVSKDVEDRRSEIPTQRIRPKPPRDYGRSDPEYMKSASEKAIGSSTPDVYMGLRYAQNIRAANPPRKKK